MEQDEELVFNAEFIKEKGEIQTEVVLDDNLDIEEVFCNCGTSGLCPHIVATLIGSELIIMKDCNDLHSALAIIQEKNSE